MAPTFIPDLLGIAMDLCGSKLRMLFDLHQPQDRYVPLPQRTLQLLSQYWVTHRNPLLLFPAEGRDHIDVAQATEPMSKKPTMAMLMR